MKLHERLGQLIFEVVPDDHSGLYRFCRRYVDRYNGDNDSNPALNGEYRFLTSELRNIGTGTVFDVGANVGDWTSFALQTNPRLHVHCFEPGAAAFAGLAGKSWPSNVRLNKVGLGEREAELDLNVIGGASGLNSLYIRHGIPAARNSETEKIVVYSIDSYCRDHAVDRLDLVKIDVEGHELAVMKGMTRMLSERRVSTIQFEYGGCALDAGVTLRDIWQFLEPFGFRFYKLHRTGPRPVAEYHPALETFRYSNWVARQSSQTR